MQTLREHPVSRNLFRTVVYLCFGSGITFLILAYSMVAFGLNETNNFVLLFIIMGLSAFVGGTLWARSMFLNSGIINILQKALLTGFSFGLSVFIFGYFLEVIERDLFYSGLLNSPGIHTQFVGYFSIAIFLVAGVTSFVLAFQMTDNYKTLRSSLTTAVTCVAVFIIVDLLMYVLGWRVGDPDFPERSTMLTVMGLGLGMTL